MGNRGVQSYERTGLGSSGTVGLLIHTAIRARGLTIAALARRANVRYDFLNAVIHGRQKLSIPVALKVAPALGLDAVDLLTLQLMQKIDSVRKRMASGENPPRPI